MACVAIATMIKLDRSLPGGVQHTLLELASYANAPEQPVWPALGSVARSCNRHVRTVRRHVAYLLRAGWLTPQGSTAGGRWTVRYRITPPPRLVAPVRNTFAPDKMPVDSSSTALFQRASTAALSRDDFHIPKNPYKPASMFVRLRALTREMGRKVHWQTVDLASLIKAEARRQKISYDGYCRSGASLINGLIDSELWKARRRGEAKHAHQR